MNLQESLSQHVKKELNHIYTEPPKIISGGLDFGWFCREHALHLFVLSKLLGKEAKICIGDFKLHAPDDKIFSSAKDPSDHAWCIIDDVEPVDVSITIKYLSKGYSDIPLVYGCTEGVGREFSIYLFKGLDDEELMSKESNPGTVIYNRKEVLDFAPQDLLDDPFQFLYPTPPGLPKFTELYGNDIFYRITWHCYKLTKDEIKPFYPYRNFKSTMNAIIKFNEEACDRIKQILLN